MPFSRVRFQPTEAEELTCPQCGGHTLIFSRTCQQAEFVCQGCGARFDPARFLDQLDDSFEETYADIPLDRM